MPVHEAVVSPPSTPLTMTQPSSDTTSAMTLRFVSGVFHSTALNMTTKEGARYSSTAATDREHMVWHLKYTMLSSRMLIRPEPRKMGKCFHLMRNTCRWNRPNTTVSTSSVPKFRINTRLPSDTPTPVSRRLENPIKPQHTALRIT